MHHESCVMCHVLMLLLWSLAICEPADAHHVCRSCMTWRHTLRILCCCEDLLAV